MAPASPSDGNTGDTNATVPLYFAYGSNMASAEMASWCPSYRFLGAARLPDHRLELRRRSIRWGGGAVDIVAAPGESVWGALYELPDEALARLDEKEGAGWAYGRREMAVELDGRARVALVYEVIDKEPREVPPTPEYARLLAEGARERGLPEEYVARLSGGAGTAC
jgi:gamma-glutamylcyclotransferase